MVKDKFNLKYFLGSIFMYNGEIIEVVAIDWDAGDKKYYQVDKVGWVSDMFLGNLKPIKLT